MNRFTSGVYIVVPAPVAAIVGQTVYHNCRGDNPAVWVVLPERQIVFDVLDDHLAARAVDEFRLPEVELAALAKNRKPPQWWYETEETLF